MHGDQRGNFCSRKQAVAGRAVVEKNNVAGLLATENISATKHFLENVAIANGGTGQRNIFAGKNALEAQVGHGGSNDAVAFELILRFEVARDGKKHTVAIHDFSRFADKERPISVTVESHSETGLFSDDAFLQAFQMQRAAASVNVTAIGRNAHGDNVRSERAEQFRAELEGCTVSAIQNDPETGELRPGNETLPQKGQVFGVEGFIGHKSSEILWDSFSAVLEDIEFEFLFDRVGEFHPGVKKQLYTVVLKGVVRSGDDHASLEIILANQAGHAGSGDHARKSHCGAGLSKTRRKQGGDVRAGFARVHADERMGGAVFSFEIRADRASGGVERAVVQRRCPRNAANPVGSKKLFRHRQKPVTAEGGPGLGGSQLLRGRPQKV